MSEKYKFISGVVLGIILLAVIISTETKIKNGQSVNLKNIFIFTAIIAFIMCCIGKAVQVNGWTNPFVIVCILLGVAALILIILFLTGKFIISEKMSFRILYSIILIKWTLTTVHHITNLIK